MLPVEDDVEVYQNWVYDKETNTFSEPETDDVTVTSYTDDELTEAYNEGLKALVNRETIMAAMKAQGATDAWELVQ